jgi:flavin-dependent dehydrogenase
LSDDVLIVGASAGGLAVAEALRRRGHQGGLTVLGAEPHRFVALYRLGGQVTGVLGWNMAKAARLHRRHVVEAISANAVP